MATSIELDCVSVGTNLPVYQFSLHNAMTFSNFVKVQSQFIFLWLFGVLFAIY